MGGRLVKRWGTVSILADMLKGDLGWEASRSRLRVLVGDEGEGSEAEAEAAMALLLKMTRR